MVVGFDKFKEYFESFRDEFIIIGGTAVQMVCGEAVAHPRVTKDIDVLVVSERMTPAFSAAFHAFLSAGRYSCYVSKNGKPHFYRFVNPKTAGFPEMIELLSSTELDGDKSFMALPDVSDDSMSAIVLDRSYYEYAIKHSTQDYGLPCLTREALIVFKAAAYMNLLEEYRRTNDPLRLHDTKKHRRDVFMLVADLEVYARADAPADIQERMRQFIEVWNPANQEWPDVLASLGLRRDADPLPRINAFRRLFEMTVMS